MAEIELDETHDPARKSWVETANRPEGQFPIQNLPYGVFRRGAGERKQIGVAIGDAILNLAGLASQLNRTISGAADILAARSLAPDLRRPVPADAVAGRWRRSGFPR